MTHRGQERLAADELRKQDFQSFLPLRLRPARVQVPGALRRHRKVEDEPVWTPAYPRYLFVLFDVQRDAWRSIHGTRGVRALFGSSPETPTAVPSAVMDQIMRLASKWGEVPRPATAAAPLPVGAIVEVAEGLLSSLPAVVIACTGKRTRILLLDHNREVEMDRAHLREPGEAAAADRTSEAA